MALDPVPHDEEPGDHRGGAWKVAYADFVTALMALFIVLWMMSANAEVRQAVSGYFKDPKGYRSQTGSARAGSGESLSITEKNVGQLKARLEHALRDSPALQKLSQYVKFTVTGEGLRIELMESSGGMFFESGSPRPTANGEKLFRMLAGELKELPNHVTLEGHTDAQAFRTTAPDAYGNWELSFDRANMARRTMLNYGLRSERVNEIRGFADRRPLTVDPFESCNRRVSVVLQYEK
ncbi:MAG TPA: flagellar motor protein MotB [Bryobacteraceae bacterium]|nr:flagellar motor protein MotB [Bryobacteraceae bacterium]